MGSSDSPLLFLFLFVASLLTVTLSQTMPVPTVAQCGPRLLSMAPCVPFVQGQVPAPSLQCCASLKEMYMKEKDCLCIFLNGTALASLPINSTLALQLPALCSPQIDPSTCSSGTGGTAGSPGSQVSFKSPSSTAATPPVESAPTPSMLGFGMGKNSAYKLKGSHVGVAALIILVLANLL